MLTVSVMVYACMQPLSLDKSLVAFLSALGFTRYNNCISTLIYCFMISISSFVHHIISMCSNAK